MSDPVHMISQQQQIQSSIPELSKLSEEEMKRLNESESALNCFVRDIMQNPLRERYQNDIDNLTKEVNQMISQNSELQTNVDERRNELLNKIPKCHHLKAQVKSLSREIDETVRREFSSAALRDDLADAVKDDEEKSDEIAEQFLRGEIDADSFRKNYVEARSRLHVRKAKREKLKNNNTKRHF